MTVLRKVVFLILLLFVCILQMKGNMAAPWINGTGNSTIYISKDIDIIKEHLSITLFSYTQAEFDVRYIVRSDKDRFSIPFIFDTLAKNGEYGRSSSGHKNFEVWLDGTQIEISEVSYIYGDSIMGHLVADLRSNFRGSLRDLSSFRYFELNLSEGEHTIHVKYVADATVDLLDKIRKYVFVYNLRPARYWKSFGGLHLTIDASAMGDDFEIDINDGKDNVFEGGVYECFFEELPQDELIITCNPVVSESELWMLENGAWAITVFITVCLIVLHFILIYRYRKKHPQKKFSVIAVGGSFLIPLISCIIFIYLTYSLDDIIGSVHASRRPGYAFLFIFFYPAFFIPYLIIALVIDLIIRLKKTAKQF